MIQQLLTRWRGVLAGAGISLFALAAGFQLGGGTFPIGPALPDEMVYIASAGLFGLGAFAILLRRPDVIGRVAPTVYVLVALLPLVRFEVPGISVIRFLPLALIAPVIYSLYRNAAPVPSHTRVARLAVFAAFATAASSLIANRAGTDVMRLLLMVGGIVLLVGAAPRAWSDNWRPSVERAVLITFWLLIVSSIVLAPVDGSFVSDRLRGAFASANGLGALLAITTPIAASRSRFGVAYWTLGFAVLIASGTRGGMLALVLAAVWVLLQKKRVFQLGAAAVIGLLILGTGIIRTQADQEVTLGVNTRQLVWGDVWEASGESPLTGYGFGAAETFEFSQETQRFAGTQPQTHSSWLDAFYEQGLLGMVPWIVVLAVGLITALRTGPVWGATVLAGLVSATFESWMFAIGGGIGSLFWLIFGAASLSAGSGATPAVPNVTDDEVEITELPESLEKSTAPKELTFTLELDTDGSR